MILVFLMTILLYFVIQLFFGCFQYTILSAAPQSGKRAHLANSTDLW
jgi:hypothetical protein